MSGNTLPIFCQTEALLVWLVNLHSRSCEDLLISVVFIKTFIIHLEISLGYFLLRAENSRKKGPKSLFKYGEKISIVCDCNRKEKINFEGSTENGCYGNQPLPFEVLFYSIDTNTSCSFTKQNLTVKQAYRSSLCFVLCNEPNF